VLAPAAVLIENGKIKQVGSPSQVQPDAPTDVRTIDLGNATLLPGLIDSHTHLLLDVNVPSEAEMTRYAVFVPGLLLAVAAKPPAESVLLDAQMAREDLESGFTTVRNLGHSGIDGDAALRDAINAGRVPGPGILAVARKLTPPGGYFQALPPALAERIIQQDFREVASPEEARRAVDEDLFYGVDLIKVAHDDDGIGITTPVMTAIVEEAHRARKKVAAHAQSKNAIQAAIDARADSIEHGNDVTDEQLKLMREKGIFFDLTPTFYGGFLPEIFSATIVMSPAFRSEYAGGVQHEAGPKCGLYLPPVRGYAAAGCAPRMWAGTLRRSHTMPSQDMSFSV
jgi:imidazolonepropionase-like amidohydrolase